MRRLTLLVPLLLGLVPAVAAPPDVTFPTVTTPAPMPAAVATLTADRLFVVESKEKVVLLSSPAGLVKVTAEQGPLTVFARFADGGERAERRTYAGPFVFLLEPVKSGETELLVIPEKVTAESDIVRRQLKVDAGDAPRPPPKPEPKPDPKPDGTSPFQGDGLRVLIVYETADLAKLPKEQAAALTSAEVRGYLNDKAAVGPDGRTREWRILDKDAEVKADAKLWADAMKKAEGKALPWVLVGNGKAGYEGPLPKDTDSLLSLLKKYGG